MTYKFLFAFSIIKMAFKLSRLGTANSYSPMAMKMGAARKRRARIVLLEI